MSARKASHGTIFLIVSSGSPLALIASSRRSTSKKPFCPMTRSLHPPATAGGQRVRFATTWRDEFFEVPLIHFINGCLSIPITEDSVPAQGARGSQTGLAKESGEVRSLSQTMVGDGKQEVRASGKGKIIGVIQKKERELISACSSFERTDKWTKE